MRTGRPSKYTDEVIEKTNNYLHNFHTLKIDEDLNEVVPTHCGLADYLGVTKGTIYNWAEEHEEFLDMLSEIKQKQEKLLLSMGLLNKTNSTITKLMLAKHDYSDASKVDNTHNFSKEATEFMNNIDGATRGLPSSD